MSDKLGYTFYPKDFISDPEVMMMTSSQRGIYRDLIDLAYMNDNKIKFSLIQLSKYCNAEAEEIKEILDLKGKKDGEFWTIPSCNKRISKSLTNRKNGAAGGRPKKPKQNPNNNPNETQTERQRERERERETKIEKENKDNIIDNANFVKDCFVSQQWLESICVKGYKMDLVLAKITEFENHLITIGEQKKSIREFKQHFVSWLAIQKSKATEKRKSPTANITI
jgi:hypothetical protein